jgi:hypothetical protein
LETIKFKTLCSAKRILFVMSVNKTSVSVIEENYDLRAMQMTHLENIYTALEYTVPLFVSSRETLSGLQYRCLFLTDVYRLPCLLKGHGSLLF